MSSFSFAIGSIGPLLVEAAGGKISRNLPLDGHDIWPSLSSGSASPRTEMLYNVNPLCSGGQAGAPKAGLRVGDFKVLAWCYSVKGIDGAEETGLGSHWATHTLR